MLHLLPPRVPGVSPWLPWLAAVSLFMETLDATILNTALPSMAASLGESPLAMQSVLVAYVLTLAVLVPLSGWVADRFGTRRTFLAAIVLFTLGSILCAMSQSLAQMIACRIVQGIGGALMLPTGRLAVLKSYPDRDSRMEALNFVALPGLIGPILGPSVGGLIVTYASWHWVFLVNVPVGVLGFVLALRHMPQLSDPSARIDVQGFLLVAGGVLLISYALEMFGEHKLGAGATTALVVAGIAAFALYVRHARRAASPLFPLAIFGNRAFSVGILGNLVARLGSGGIPLLLPLFLQLAYLYSPAHAGLILMAIAAAALVAKPAVVPLIRRFGSRTVLLVSSALVGAAILALAFTGPGTSNAYFVGVLLVFGLAVSLQFSTLNSSALAGLPPEHASAGNMLLSTAMQLALSIGLTFAMLVLSLFMGRNFHPDGAETFAAYHATFVTLACVSWAGSLVFLLLGERKRPA
ncbi:DHA2 family efflux MFS transporter permease subunit [Crenobacter caeni]|uniref:DHA2 family efflux MFS transporter permease subunit n=1 Tax=Crenobacter caeni TaxID=2705474 RepID=A0A6B2KUD9_9NEIS|nr:DHA2 family efflux MFS transporter permease subunit [Crenobacter caeni]NDV13680.1 DHA2 family efflux MFS transporter permease subunit [Crenobacter caeni]